MDYKIISPSDYFVTIGGQGQSGHGTLLMNPHVVHGAANPHFHGGEVGLNVLASGAVAAGQAQSQGQYGGNDNYGYIVSHNRILGPSYI